ncbi:hypothetical protein Glove_13g229 [Diversispora epigaea]|uniref:BTB domain-containing protein n=1 Tax=Diversispora epigaea TaxID=1348612 RepID=A0A397JMD8_9GLOM|nr:hypothetical protein Glove_13g229 [Diversispora epigaea]
MSLKFFDKLSQNFIELLNDKDDYNVIIEIENKKKSFTAHSNILKYRSPYFRKELENIQTNENNVKTIFIRSSVSAQIFDVILKYIYGGIVNLENVETRFIFDLMLATNEFELDELTNKLETQLIDTEASWLKTYFSFIYRTIFNENNFKKLENYCNDIIAKHPSLIFENLDFTSLPESALVSLLKRDDLQMEEVKIWDYVIKWGISQNPTLPINLEEWSKENLLMLKTTLLQCLPLIRYFHISNTELFDKIMPYKKILDKQLCKDIIQYLAVPDRPFKSIILPARSTVVTELPPRAEEPKEPFSTIISEEHAAEISSWIDRKIFRMFNYSTENIPYKFELILSGTRDGFAPQTFWNICHGHANTVVVAKVKGTDEILGGYNPLTWDNSYNGRAWGIWKETKDSFIFSLKNGDIQNSILSRVKRPEEAIWYMSKRLQKLRGPDFGDFCLYTRSTVVTELPPRAEEPKEPFSTIISEEHAAEISSWIDRKIFRMFNYSTENIPYKFELILSGTRDGFAPQTFWNICHGHANTVVVAKVKGTDEILGGYNPLTWDNSYNGRAWGIWKETKDSFIFSLKNGDIQNSILSRVKRPEEAIWYMSKRLQKLRGPDFGDFCLYSEKSDFTLDNRNYCNSNRYEKPTRTSLEKFSIVNYEVFKVIKKNA